jgi:two-component system cell cycle sensor histidine kinase/response regulator CckA
MTQTVGDPTFTLEIRGESSSEPAEPRWIDLNHVVDRLDAVLARLMGSGIALDIRAAAGLPYLYADPRQLEQVVLCLAANALVAIPRGGALCIATRNVEIDGCPYLCLSVRSTATDIGEAAGRRMFDSLFTPDLAAEETDLGLAKVRDIVHTSGGQIDFAAVPGRGAAASLYWKTRGQAAQPIPPMNPPRIVIADDYPAIRAWLRHVIQSGRPSFELFEAADGEEVIRLVRAGGVDLVITDIIMPDKEGIETIQTVRREAPHVAIVAISGSLHREYLEMARILGADATLQKPLSAEAVLETVDRLLPHRD